MNVFSDLHHSSLFYSLQLLFEKRLGYNLYRPIGLDWYIEGYWKLNNLEETARQYLERGYQPLDGTLPLNEIEKQEINQDYSGKIFYLKDEHNNTTQKAITLNVFKVMPIDIVIATIPAHIEPFKKLAQMKGAKFIFQAGNVFPEVQYNTLPNLMTNTMPQYPPNHVVQYHQEFDLNIFKPKDIAPEKQIVSFINVYQDNGGFQDYITLKAMMPEYSFLSFGGQCQDGSVATTQMMAEIMQRSYFGFHSKAMGDGYGHVLYNWFACGKPVITRISDYKGKLGEELLEDGVTCLDIDKHPLEEIQYNIENLAPTKYEYMCQQVYKRFQDKVNFDSEEIKIREFLNNLV